MKNKSYYKYIFLIILFSIPSIWFLLKPGFFQSDDGEWMIIRFSAFYQALRDGQFPVRFLERLNYGYGYPVVNFLYPGFMYLGVPLKILGFSFVSVVKILMAGSMIFSGVFMFLWIRKFYDNIYSFLASLLYIYAPYHLYDLTRRGSLGELMSLAIAPFVFWQIENKNVLFLSIGIAILVLSHNTLALLFLSFAICYMAVNVFKASDSRKNLGVKYLLSVLFGMGLSAFFWIPALSELRFTNFGNTEISTWSEYFVDYKMLGIPLLLIFAVVLLMIILKKVSVRKNSLVFLCIIFGFLSLFFSSSISSPLWNILPVSFIQFPFRLLSIVIFSAAFLFAYILSKIEGKYAVIAGVITILALVFLGRDYLVPVRVFDQGDAYYSTNEATTTVKDEYMPVWVMNKPDSHYQDKAVVIDGNGVISSTSQTTKTFSFQFEGTTSAVVRVSTIYYPGWEAEVDDIDTNISFDNEYGLIDIPIQEGKHKVNLTFNETLERNIANMISLVSAVMLVGYVAWGIKKRK